MGVFYASSIFSFLSPVSDSLVVVYRSPAYTLGSLFQQPRGVGGSVLTFYLKSQGNVGERPLTGGTIDKLQNF